MDRHLMIWMFDGFQRFVDVFVIDLNEIDEILM